MNPDPVVLINAFEVPDGQDEAFLAARERARHASTGISRAAGRRKVTPS